MTKLERDLKSENSMAMYWIKMAVMNDDPEEETLETIIRILEAHKENVENIKNTNRR